ncbi:MAG: (d)CMP kinase [Bacilli bacterium]|nr:(d)CMP kinase [Bacilli bacterium]
MYNIIAIDGTSGSGKGTIAKEVAKRLNYSYIDTGAMYRCVALKSLEENIDIKEEDKIVDLLKNMDIKINNDGTVYLDDRDVSTLIRTEDVNEIVPKIANIVPLRLVMKDKQREMANKGNIVMEGRDITTHIFPNAQYKFYIDASLDIRAERRYKQNLEKGIESTLEEVKKNLEERDYNDMNRTSIGALKRTDDQHYIDNGKNTLEESVNEILKIVGEE